MSRVNTDATPRSGACAQRPTRNARRRHAHSSYIASRVIKHRSRRVKSTCRSDEELRVDRAEQRGGSDPAEPGASGGRVRCAAGRLLRACGPAVLRRTHRSLLLLVLSQTHNTRYTSDLQETESRRPLLFIRRACG